MSDYRMHIDIPLGMDQEKAIRLANEFISTLGSAQNEMGLFCGGHGLDPIQINYRLGHDDDRQKSNYLNMDAEGHVNNKKTRLTFKYDVI
tara:strand:- start:35 stop:304 length:270 start_codon:yes stop_codon:yes gene_type:complete